HVHLMVAASEFVHPRRRDRHPVLGVLDLARDPDLHLVHPLSPAASSQPMPRSLGPVGSGRGDQWPAESSPPSWWLPDGRGPGVPWCCPSLSRSSSPRAWLGRALGPWPSSSRSSPCSSSSRSPGSFASSSPSSSCRPAVGCPLWPAGTVTPAGCG